MASHLLLDLMGCDKEILNDLGLLKAAFYSAAAGSPVVTESFHLFQPQGISGTVWFDSLCLFFHTWPEHRYAAIDILSYQDEPQAAALIQGLVKTLGTKSSSVSRVERQR